MTYLFDSSAWLTHIFDEPGVEEINQLFADSQVKIAICALSITEVYTSLLAKNREEHWPKIWEGYSDLYSQVLPVDAEVAQRANMLRSQTPHRLPTIDGLIAATAAIHGCTLVHRDSHLAEIPTNLLNQIMLPPK